MMQGLRDIKGLVEVPDTSLWQLLALIAAIVLLALIGAWLYTRYSGRRRRRRRKSPLENATERLWSIDYGDTKEAVYTFTENMKIIADRKGPIPGLEELLERLEKYKYRREVPNLGKEDKKAMQKMIEEVTHV